MSLFICLVSLCISFAFFFFSGKFFQKRQNVIAEGNVSQIRRENILSN